MSVPFESTPLAAVVDISSPLAAVVYESSPQAAVIFIGPHLSQLPGVNVAPRTIIISPGENTRPLGTSSHLLGNW